MAKSLPILSAGAAQGLITRAATQLLEQLQVATTGRFGAVGAMREAFNQGEPCDLIVLTEAMIQAMRDEGLVQSESACALGTVYTGVAVPAGQPQPDITTPEALAAALMQANSLWLPDIERSTAGLHLMKVLRELGLAQPLGDRLNIFPNGATAMRAMAESGDKRAIGCTQLSEILFTSGVDAVGRLPQALGLGTVYSAAVTTRARQPVLAQAVIAALTHPAAAALRRGCGFD